jgi:hypothetical protein
MAAAPAIMARRVTELLLEMGIVVLPFFICRKFNDGWRARKHQPDQVNRICDNWRRQPTDG